MNMTKTKIIECLQSDPFSMYAKLRKLYKYTAILESLGDLDDETSRYTIIGVIPAERIIVNDDICIYEDLKSHKTKQVNFLEIVDEWINPRTIELGNNNLFQLGAIGYLGYNIKHYFEKLDRSLEKDNKCPDAYLVKYSLLNVTDRVSNKSYWIIDADMEQDVIKKTEEYLKQPIEKSDSFKVHGDCKPDFKREDYLNIIEKTRDYIKAGDIFQANITCRFSGKCSGDSFELYTYLRTITPNPFFAYLDFENPVLSTSPERFLKIHNNSIWTYPIKGTAKCLIDGIDQKDILSNSEKNIAENVMITDLLRNDIGRVCVQNSVNVKSLCGLKKFNDLYHLESIIQGNLKKNITFSDILQATFPGGSITGAPKIRSVDIIEELELTQRGPYTGAIGFFGENGYIDTNIAIRTIYFDNENLYFHAGGGITIGSVPEDEYDELILKASNLMKGIENFNILKKYRAEIDKLDTSLMKLFDERFGIIKEVGKVKRQYDIPIMQDNRVNQVISGKVEMCNKYSNVPEVFVIKLYNEIINHSMSIEENVGE
jgi:para-aminobenzoate synthetase component 1